MKYVGFERFKIKKVTNFDCFRRANAPKKPFFTALHLRSLSLLNQFLTNFVAPTRLKNLLFGIQTAFA